MEQASDPARGDASIYALRDEQPEIVMEPPDPSWFTCSFCRRTDRPTLFGAAYPVRAPNTFAVITHVCICGDCVTRFSEQLAQEGPEAPPGTA